VELCGRHSVKAQSKVDAQNPVRYPTYSPGGIDMRGVKLYRIRSIASSVPKKPIQIELQNVNGGWYVGALDWVLWIGNSKFRHSLCNGENWASAKFVCFTLSRESWESLRQDEPLIVTWGDDELQPGRTLPFAKLDKTLLNKKPRKKIRH
jgi:hypothetical protein